MTYVRTLFEDTAVRAGPGLKFDPPLVRLPKDMLGTVIMDTNECNSHWTWHYVRFETVTGWVRSDVVQLWEPPPYSGVSGAILTGQAPKMPTATPHELGTAGVIRTSSYEFKPAFELRDIVQGTFEGGWGAYGGAHKGWDISNVLGIPVYAPLGGVVTQTSWCNKCGDLGKSSQIEEPNTPLYQIYRDKGWNGGFGHFVVVQWTPELLPDYVQTQHAGMSAFILFGHLSAFTCVPGQRMKKDANQIGRMGNSGNSSGNHLHIELRFAKQVADWSRLPASEDPGKLIKR